MELCEQLMLSAALTRTAGAALNDEVALKSAWP